MNCMKCGRETVSEQVFCEICLQEMEKYPVNPGTAVKLPERKDPPIFRRPPKRRSVPLEEQVKILKDRVFRLLIVLLLSFGIIFLMIPSIVELHTIKHRKLGQNYSVITPTEETKAAP